MRAVDVEKEAAIAERGRNDRLAIFDETADLTARTPTLEEEEEEETVLLAILQMLRLMADMVSNQLDAPSM